MIPVHSMFYANYKDFLRLSPKTFLKTIKPNLIALHGNLNDMKKLKVLPQKRLEPYFFVLDFEMNSRIKTFPRHLVRTSAESLFEYLNKKYNIKAPKEIPHDINEIEKEFVLLMKELDKRTYGN